MYQTIEPRIASQLLNGLVALREGDFSFRLPGDLTGLDGKLADTFNDVIATNQRMAQELARISRVVGRDGRLGQRAALGEVRGCWADSVDSVNALIDDLVHPTGGDRTGDRRSRQRGICRSPMALASGWPQPGKASSGARR